MMDIFDIFIAYIEWGDNGKRRPVLIIERQEEFMSVFNITTQYENKSETIRSKYFKINDWQRAGLDRQSYVDVGTVRILPKSAWNDKTAIGKLTDTDVLRLIAFLSNTNK